MREYLDFEKPLIKFDEKIEKLKPLAKTDPEARRKIQALERESRDLQAEIYANLTPWQRTQLARHPSRPNTQDYISLLFNNFVELHGDRYFGDDRALIAGVGLFHHRPVVVIGNQKGKVFKEKVKRNFGMPHPEGYRKALRLMKLAEKFSRPVITLIDTPGAYPGMEAEERGQSEAIARNLYEMSRLRVPIIAVVIGEGGSGGALALGVADRVLMLEHSIYSVISPEGCAAILWNDPAKAPAAAEALKMTAKDLLSLEVIDQIISEPLAGAHKDPPQMSEILDKTLVNQLSDLDGMPIEDLVEARYQKFKAMGMVQSKRRTTD
ncbi:MAG TPA: acetyl-CoA carboxylase carboxyltransferase subunit alpha [Nitrospiria bacterium]|nr:acetyl-CoA carboxylase carboxyltransferase subunit alpha [Nitrospiria bacterium]